MEPHGNLVSGPDSGVYIEGGGEERGSNVCGVRCW